ncbi:MAG: hypothetical protein JHD02_03855 [Thermoleophilaceae bacterium]|nr:hypothetical protein [Thermoleophilaceae bacterium]
MHRQIARLSLVATLAAACTLCASAWASAATAKFDTSYQNGGTVQLPQVRGVFGQVVQSCEISGDRLNVAGRFGPNENGMPTAWKRDQALATTAIKIRPRQPMTLGVADVRWHKQRIPSGQVVLDQDFDSDGGFAYVTHSTRKALRTKMKLFRILPNGRRNANFGHNGYVSITIPSFTSESPEGFRVIALPAGKVLLLAQNSNRLYVLRFTRRGRPDKTWGTGGSISLNGPTTEAHFPLSVTDAATALPGGGLLVPANAIPGQPTTGTVGLLKLTATGARDLKWADKGFWRTPAAGTPKGDKEPYTYVGNTLLTAVRKGGGFAVLWADTTSAEDSSESDLKLAYVSETSGVTELFNDEVGYHATGGDGGFPDSEPWALGESVNGTVVAQAESFYGRVSNTYGVAGRFSPDANQPITEASANAKGFPTDAFAIDPKTTNLYFCGSLGSTSSKSTVRANRDQRKSIAIRRVKL